MKHIEMTNDLFNYVAQHNPRPHPILAKVAEETARRTDSRMQVSKDQGAFMHMLVKLMGVKRAVEVGCFTGYSAISVASGLPRGGELYTLDISPETMEIAKKFFAEAGLQDRIKPRLGDAVKSLAELERELGRDSFDFAFIDADKENYDNYYEACLRLVRPGGLIVVDNVIWSGKVVDYSDQSEATVAIRAFNEKVQYDERVERAMVAISDGIYLLRKKSVH